MTWIKKDTKRVTIRDGEGDGKPPRQVEEMLPEISCSNLKQVKEKENCLNVQSY